LSFQQIGEEASSNFSCFEFLLANGGVLRDRKQAVEHFPIKRKSFLLVPRFVLRIGRDGGKLRVPISVALPEKKRWRRCPRSEAILASAGLVYSQAALADSSLLTEKAKRPLHSEAAVRH